MCRLQRLQSFGPFRGWKCAISGIVDAVTVQKLDCRTCSEYGRATLLSSFFRLVAVVIEAGGCWDCSPA